MILVSIHAQLSRTEFKVQRWKQLETIFRTKKLTVDVLQNCPVAPHFTSTASLLDCPSTRIMQVRVDGQSSSDTVKKKWITLT